MSTNIAFFYSDYTDIQIPGSVGVDTDGDGVSDTFAGVTTNAGEATIKGVEFEGTALLGRDLMQAGDSLNALATVGYIDPNSTSSSRRSATRRPARPHWKTSRTSACSRTRRTGPRTWT